MIGVHSYVLCVVCAYAVFVVGASKSGGSLEYRAVGPFAEEERETAGSIEPLEFSRKKSAKPPGV